MTCSQGVSGSDKKRGNLSDSLEFGLLSGPLTLNSKTPPRAPSLSSMSQQSSTQVGTPVRASSELPRSGLRERLKNLRAGSRIEADGRRLNKQIAGQSQPTSPASGIAVRSSSLQSFGQAETPPVSASGFVTGPRESPAAVQTPTGLKDTPPPAQSIVLSAENGQSSSGSKITKSTQNPATMQPLERQASEQSRIETQRSEVPADVPLPLHISQPKSPFAKSSNNEPLAEEVYAVSQVVSELKPNHLGPVEFVVSLGMSPRMRDHYISIIRYYPKAIEDSQKERISRETLNQIELMLERLNRITTHMDLDMSEATTQEDVPAENLAKWALDCSEKFRFLHYLLDSLRYTNKHIAIVAKSGQLLDIVETFLKGNFIAYNRPDVFSKSDPKNVKGYVEVTLLPSGIEGSTTLPSGANLIVALDGSFNRHDPQVMNLRTHVTNVGQLAPVIHLLVYNSAEHIERCIPKTLNHVDRVRRIVSCLTQAGDEVGQLLPDEASPSAAAEEVAAFLEAGGLEHDWTFPSIRPIEGIVAIEYSQGVETVSQSEPEYGQRIVAPATALKRALVSNAILSLYLCGVTNWDRSWMILQLLRASVKG